MKKYVFNITDEDRMLEVAKSLNPKWFKSVEYYVDDKDNKSYTIIEMGYVVYAFVRDFMILSDKIKEVNEILKGLQDEAKRLSTKSSR